MGNPIAPRPYLAPRGPLVVPVDADTPEHEVCPVCGQRVTDPARFAAHVLDCDGSGQPARPVKPAFPKSEPVR